MQGNTPLQLALKLASREAMVRLLLKAHGMSSEAQREVGSVCRMHAQARRRTQLTQSWHAVQFERVLHVVAAQVGTAASPKYDMKCVELLLAVTRNVNTLESVRDRTSVCTRATLLPGNA